MPNAVRFAVTPLTPVSELEAHISTNEARGLPEAVPEPATAFLCASGPSLALDGPESFWAAHEARPEVPVIAVNGALGPLLARNAVPTFWAACDGAEKVADFLTEVPAETIYLVASRCHPKVFERLKGRLVRVWRLDGVAFEGAGTKSLQFVRTARGWKIAALAWTDDSPGGYGR